MSEYMVKSIIILVSFNFLSACADNLRNVSYEYRDIEGVAVTHSIDDEKGLALINFVRQCTNTNCVAESENHYGWTRAPINIRYITLFQELEHLPIAYEVGVEPEKNLVVVLRLQEKEGESNSFVISVVSLDQLD